MRSRWLLKMRNNNNHRLIHPRIKLLLYPFTLIYKLKPKCHKAKDEIHMVDKTCRGYKSRGRYDDVRWGALPEFNFRRAVSTYRHRHRKTQMKTKDLTLNVRYVYEYRLLVPIRIITTATNCKRVSSSHVIISHIILGLRFPRANVADRIYSIHTYMYNQPTNQQLLLLYYSHFAHREFVFLLLIKVRAVGPPRDLIIREKMCFCVLWSLFFGRMSEKMQRCISALIKTIRSGSYTTISFEPFT